MIGFSQQKHALPQHIKVLDKRKTGLYREIVNFKHLLKHNDEFIHYINNL